MKTVLFALLSLTMWGCTKPLEKTLPEIDMLPVEQNQIGVMWDNPYICFEHFSACFLENTGNYNSTDILHFEADQDTLFLSCKGELRKYDKEGKLTYRFDLPESYITSFDLDTLHQNIYVLDSINSQVLGFKYNGVPLFRTKLPTSCYSLHYIGENKLLLTSRAIPQPETFFLDINSLQFIPIQKPDYPKEKRDIPNFYHQAKEGVLKSQEVEIPLFTYSRTHNGIYLKYLFNDTIYQVSPQGIKAFMTIQMGKERVTLKNKHRNILKKNKHFYIINFWSPPYYWVVSYALDYKGFILMYHAWFNKKGQLLQPNLAFYIPDQIYEIGMDKKENLFMNQRNNCFYNIIPYTSKTMQSRKKNLPPELQSFQSGNLLLIKATFIDKDCSKKLEF